MSDFLHFLVLGLGPGALYAVLAVGVVLIYRGSGVVNFGLGGFALVGAAVYMELQGSLSLGISTKSRLVTYRNDDDLERGVTENDLRTHMLSQLAPYKTPRTYELIETMKELGIQCGYDSGDPVGGSRRAGGRR